MLHHRRVAKQRHFHPPWMQIQWVTLLRLATRLKSEQTFIHHREHPEDGLPGVSRRKFDLAMVLFDEILRAARHLAHHLGALTDG